VEIIAFLRFKIDGRRHLDGKEGCYRNRRASRRPLAGERRWTPRLPGAGRRLRNWTRLRSESLQPYTERSSRPGPEMSNVEADVYVWRYALLVVHARKDFPRSIASSLHNCGVWQSFYHLSPSFIRPTSRSYTFHSSTSKSMQFFTQPFSPMPPSCQISSRSAKRCVRNMLQNILSTGEFWCPNGPLV